MSVTDDRSLPQLGSELANNLSELFRNEVRLARVEAVDGVRQLGAGAAQIGGGFALAAAALTLALMALAFALGEVMPLWLGAFLSALIGGIAAYALVRSGIKAMSANKIALPRTQEQVARDIALLKEKMPS